MLGGKAAAQTGGQIQRLLRSLNDQRAGAAERVLHERVTAHAAQIGDGGGQRFLDGCQRGVFAVAALVQAVTGGVEIDLHRVLAQRKADLVQRTVLRQGSDLMAVHQPLDDGFFYDALAGRDAGQLAGQARALDREGRVGGEQLLPRDSVATVKQFIKGGGLVGGQQQQHALGGAQVQVGGGDHIRPALKCHTAVRHLNILCAQTLDLKVQRGFGTEEAGRDHRVKCRHRCPFLLICRELCRGEQWLSPTFCIVKLQKDPSPAADSRQDRAVHCMAFAAGISRGGGNIRRDGSPSRA